MNSVSQREKRSDHLLEKIRLVVCDLDGTLLKTDKTLDERIISIIQNKQYMFTVASGRSAVLVKDYVDALGVRMPYITNNGAQVYDARHGCMKQYDIAQGEVGFIIELAKKMKMPVTMNFMDVSSYGDGTESSGHIKILRDLDEDITGKNVLLVEDIIDSGRTLSKLRTLLIQRNPKKLKLCTLLDKPDRRVTEVPVDYVGFTIPDAFVVGYGLDYAQKYRNLDYVGVVHFEEE